MAGDSENSNKNKPDALDQNSPYYLHPSDYPRQMHVKDALSDKNYADWVQETENFLFAKNKIGFVDGTIKKPEKNSQDYIAWMRCDAMIKGWLTTAMEKEIRDSVKYANSAAEIWSDLRVRFGKESVAFVGTEPSPIPGLTTEQYITSLKYFGKAGFEDKEGEQPVANMAGRQSDDDDWVVDSGATEHTTYRADILENKRKGVFERPVIIPNGDAIPVEGRGDYTLPGGNKIEGVLYVPKFNCNLLSVSRLAKNLQCAVIFFPDFCVMQGLRSRTLIGAGECKNGLYRMGIFGDERKVMAITVEQWHKRLGHASEGKLTKVDFLKKHFF